MRLSGSAAGPQRGRALLPPLFRTAAPTTGADPAMAAPEDIGGAQQSGQQVCE